MVLTKLLAGFTPSRSGENMLSAKKIVSLVKNFTNRPVLSFLCGIALNLQFKLNMLVS